MSTWMVWFIGALVFFGIVFIFGFGIDMVKLAWEELNIWLDGK